MSWYGIPAGFTRFSRGYGTVRECRPAKTRTRTRTRYGNARGTTKYGEPRVTSLLPRFHHHLNHHHHPSSPAHTSTPSEQPNTSTSRRTRQCQPHPNSTKTNGMATTRRTYLGGVEDDETKRHKGTAGEVEAERGKQPPPPTAFTERDRSATTRPAHTRSCVHSARCRAPTIR